MPADNDRAEQVNDEPVALDLLGRSVVRTRAVTVVLAAVVLGAAIGGVVGLVGGRPAGLFTAAVIALPLFALAWGESRRRTTLRGSVISVRMFGTREVDLRRLSSVTLLITDMRGTRTIGLLAGGGPDKRTVNVALAIYSGTGGRELGILPLRKLADALARTEDTRALVVSTVLVHQLRAEAKGVGASERPLFRLASLAPQGRLAQRFHPDALARFVATLE
jgi:hypothetical protein